MKKKIESANLMYYNANTAGNSSPDCVKRSISYAFDKSYIQVSKDLNEVMKKGYDAWNIPLVYSQVIKKYGGSDRLRLHQFDPENLAGDPNITVDAFADRYNTGSYVLEVGKTPQGNSSHCVAIVDGEVVDSWDSRKWYVKKVFKTNHEHMSKTDLWNSENVKNLKAACVTQVRANYEKLVAKYEEKNDWEFLTPHDIEVADFSYRIQVIVTSTLRSQLSQKKITHVEVKFVFTPTMTYEEALDYIAKNAYVRVYDRLYEINKKIQGLIEEEQAANALRSELGVGDQIDQGLRNYWLNGREKAFYNSLPGSIRGRIKYINIQQPGQFSDSYRIKLYSTPADKERTGESWIEFEAYDASQMKDMLNRYQTKGEIPYYDYEPAEEY